ncbi:hypothetical protein, partial [Fusicatenibacter saccharivorans]|uniref:hypothetical protein n=1 Tax=Fusicatenibacter saccharivorans TaxID=1150298 RepID=UPI001A9BC5BE
TDRKSGLLFVKVLVFYRLPPNKPWVLIIPQGKTATETETENRIINNLINHCFFSFISISPYWVNHKIRIYQIDKQRF